MMSSYPVAGSTTQQRGFMTQAVLSISNVADLLGKERPATCYEKSLGLIGLFDSLTDSANNERAAEAMRRTAFSFILDHIKILRRYAQQPSYYHRVRASLVVELALIRAHQESFRVRRMHSTGPVQPPELTLLYFAGNHAVIARNRSSTGLYQIRNGSVRHFNPSVLPEQIKASQSENASADEDSGAFSMTQKIEVIHIETEPNDWYILASNSLANFWAKGKNLSAIAEAQDPSAELDVQIGFAREHDVNGLLTAIAVQTPNKSETTLDAQLMERVAPLRVCAPLQLLNDHELLKVLGMMKIRDFKTAEKIVSEGDDDDSMFVAITGAFSVTKNGKKIAELGPGTFFGEMGLINGGPRHADVVASKPSRMLELTRSNFRKLLTNEPQITSRLLWALCQVLNERLAKTTDDLTFTASESQIIALPKQDAEITLVEENPEGAGFYRQKTQPIPSKSEPASGTKVSNKSSPSGSKHAK
jgi:CRP-like cAMP-binding protein